MSKGKLGLGSAISVCVGLIVATSCLVSLGTGMGLTGRWFIIPLFVVMFLNVFVGFSYAELHRLMPKVDGGTGQYLLTGVGPVLAIIGTFGVYVVTMNFSASGEIAMTGMVAKDVFGISWDYRVVSLIVLVLFFIVNLFGVDLFSKVQNVVVVLLVGSMLALGIIGCIKGGTGIPVEYANPSLADVGGISGLMSLAAIAFWLYIGVEFVIPVAKDMKNPKRDVLLSIILGLVMLFVTQAILGWGMTNYVNLGTLAADPTGMPHMTFATNLLGQGGRYWMGVITFLAAISTMNTVFVSTSKVLQGMAEEGVAPEIFAKTNKHGAAYIGLIFNMILVGGIVISNLAASEGITFIILAASCFWLVTYCLIHATILILRKKYPDADRIDAIKLWGIPQILGILGNIYMIWNIESGDTRIKIYEIVGVIFVILIAYSFIWVCGKMKVKPFKQIPMETFTEEGLSFKDALEKNKQEEKMGDVATQI